MRHSVSNRSLQIPKLPLPIGNLGMGKSCLYKTVSTEKALSPRSRLVPSKSILQV